MFWSDPDPVIRTIRSDLIFEIRSGIHYIIGSRSGLKSRFKIPLKSNSLRVLIKVLQTLMSKEESRM